MSSVQAITTNVCEDQLVDRCLLCRRVRRFYREQGGSGEWEDLSGFLTHYRLVLSSLQVVDVYCETCETFYRQLLTYGQPDQPRVESTADRRITA
jgi:hypothetical protein